MLILLVLLIFFAALGIPLAFAIGASCVTYILIYAPTFITMLPQRVWNGAYSELMIAMPLFMLAGELMNTGGITQRIRALVPVLIPLFISAFRRADELAVAMECRCYHGDEGRTRMKQLTWCTRDTLAMVWSALVLAGVIVLARFGL